LISGEPTGWPRFSLDETARPQPPLISHRGRNPG